MATRSGKMYALEKKFKELEVKSEKTEKQAAQTQVEAKKVKQHCHNAAVSLRRQSNKTNGSWGGKRLGGKSCKS